MTSPITPPGDPLHGGMPVLDPSAEKLSFYEFWPQPIFYAPVVVWWIWFSIRYRGIALPTAANPGFPHGGFVGESKAAVLLQFGPEARRYLAPFHCHRRSGERPVDDELHDLEIALEQEGLDYPLVAKPDIGCRGVGVKRIEDRAALRRYLTQFPKDGDIVLQDLVEAPGEVGVFYVRYPNQSRGKIFSMTLKYLPHLRGDGRRTLRELILADERAGRLSHLYLDRNKDRLDEVIPDGQSVRIAFAGSHSRGAIFRDGRPFITAALREKIDQIAKDIDGFYIGRFDIRFSDFEALRRGEDIRLIEVNGAGGEATHIWDSRMRLIDSYRDLYQQFKMLFEIGRENRNKGVKPSSPLGFFRAWRHESRLVKQYPETD